MAFHLPIEIDGDTNFTAANGVTGGTGSPEDPYVLENLEIEVGDSNNGLVIFNTTSHVVIRNVSIRAETHGGGIYLALASNVTVEGASISGSGWGILAEEGRDISISKLTATSSNGVAFLSSDRVSVSDARLIGANSSSLYLAWTTNASLRNVSVEAGYISLDGNEIEHFRSHTMAGDVTVAGKPVQYVTDCAGALTPSPGVGEFFLVGCEDVVIKDTSFETDNAFMQFAFVRGLLLTGNTFRSGFAGAAVTYSQGIRIASNTIEDSAFGGFYVSKSEGVTISANALRPTSGVGVLLQDVSDFSVVGNSLYGALETAISVGDSKAGRVEGNVIQNASSAGIEVSGSSQIFVASNTVTDSMAFGLRLSSLSDSRVEANRIARAGGVGLSLTGSQAVAVVGNDIDDGSVGISLDQVAGGALIGNWIAGNSGAGLRLGVVRTFSIDGNVIDRNGQGVQILPGYRFDPRSLGIGPDNLVDGRPMVYRSACNGATLDGALPYFMIIANCTDVRITNATFDGSQSRLWLYDVDGGQITGMRFNGIHETALRIENSRNVIATDNTFSRSTATAAVLVDSENLSFLRNQVETAEGQGVSLNYCSNCTVSHNQLVASNGSAIEGYVSDNLRIEENEILGGVQGITVTYSQRVRIERNVIKGFHETGIAAGDGNQMSIVNNQIESSLGRAIALDWMWYSNVSGNTIVGNREGLAISYGWNISVWLNEFSANSNHSLALDNSSGIYVFANNFDRVPGSVWMDDSWARFHQGWVTGGNYWAGRAIHDECGGSDQHGGCGPPDGFDDGSFFVTNDWRAWYALSERATDADRDGLADSWEERFGLDPSNPADADDDPDADGLSNLQEFVRGGSPVDADTDGDLVPDTTDNQVWWQSEDYTGRQEFKFMGIVFAGVIAGTLGLALCLSRVARKAQGR